MSPRLRKSLNGTNCQWNYGVGTVLLSQKWKHTYYFMNNIFSKRFFFYISSLYLKRYKKIQPEEFTWSLTTKILSKQDEIVRHNIGVGTSTFNKYNHNHYPFFFFFAWKDSRFLISLAPPLSIWFQCHCTMTSDLSLDHMIFTIRSITLTVQMINTDAMYSSKHMCQFEFQEGKTELTEKYLKRYSVSNSPYLQLSET